MFDQPIRRLATRTRTMGVLLTTALLSAAPAAAAPAIPADGHASAGQTGDRAPALAAAVPPGYSVQGVDVSHHQNTINWASVAASGQKFSYAKATEGVSFIDPNFSANNRGAKQNGLYAGAYTFARPDRSNGNAAADYLVDHAQWATDGRSLPPMLDIEWPWDGSGAPSPCYGLSTSQMVTWIRDFVNRVKDRTGQQAMIYTNANWWNPCTGNNAGFADYPLYHARYASSPTPLPAGWSRWTLWQYTSSASIPGISGGTDHNVFNGTLADLAALAGATAPASAKPSSQAFEYLGQLHYVARSSTDSLTHHMFIPGTGWDREDLGGQLAGQVAGVVYGSLNQAHAFARTPGGTLGHWYFIVGNGWGYEDLGGQLVGDPAASTWNGQLHVFGRASNGTLAHWFFIPGDGWDTENLGGRLVGDPATSVWGDQLHVFGRAADNALAHWKFVPGSGWGTENLGGQFVGDPAVSTWDDQLHVFGRASNGTLAHWFFVPGDGWGTENLGGQLVGDPAVSTWRDQLHVFGRAADNTLAHWNFVPGTGWDTENLGGQLVGDPAASAWGEQLHAFGRASDGTLTHWFFIPGDGWATENLGGSLHA
jgi:GH25 family lysozyme M1 (1,4-beta-N-acetylmuramidase)